MVVPPRQGIFLSGFGEVDEFAFCLVEYEGLMGNLVKITSKKLNI